MYNKGQIKRLSGFLLSKKHCKASFYNQLSFFLKFLLDLIKIQKSVLAGYELTAVNKP